MYPPENSLEGTIIVLVQWPKLATDYAGVVLVAMGICVAVAQLSRIFAARQIGEFTAVRLTFAELGPAWKARGRGCDSHGIEFLSQ